MIRVFLRVYPKAKRPEALDDCPNVFIDELLADETICNVSYLLKEYKPGDRTKERCQLAMTRGNAEYKDVPSQLRHDASWITQFVPTNPGLLKHLNKAVILDMDDAILIAAFKKDPTIVQYLPKRIVTKIVSLL